MIDPNELERLSNPREALEEAWEHLCQTSLSFRRYACTTIPGGDGWTMTGRFCRFLDAEAWTDAALMLIGPDRWLEFKGPRKYLNIPTPVPAAWSAHIAQWNHEGDVVGWGDTLAEAIAAACIKAKEQAALRAQEAGDA